MNSSLIAEQIKIEWQAFKIARSKLPRSIGMIDPERDEYAGNLAGAAVVHLRKHKADHQSCDLARRMLALALHLSPRNKKALVANAQLGRGIVPEPPETDYRPQTLARLLMTRAQQLEKQQEDTKEQGRGNVELAGYLLSLAMDLDPKNEDAIYLSELHRINHGEVNWTQLLLDKQ